MYMTQLLLKVIIVSCEHNLSVHKIHDSQSMAQERKIFFHQCSLVYFFSIQKAYFILLKQVHYSLLLLTIIVKILFHQSAILAGG